jgi:RNA polymerase II subunit A small phosphatase-like protein
VFTAGTKGYADAILDKLDVHKTISVRLYKSHCTKTITVEGKVIYGKDLSKLGRKLDHVFIIDDSPDSFLLYPRNAIEIKPWREYNPYDAELPNLMGILVDLCLSG